ncbi:MAG: ribonuclease P protein component [Mariprofundaceae bacterium]|nr:ribonuclease P protein component [Mariprofundaceae bacterium]
MNQKYVPALRLRSKSDFARLRRGKKYVSGQLLIVHGKNNLNHACLGLAVSRKYGNAVQRNRLKRRMREVYRCHPLRHLSVDILIIPRTGWQSMKDPIKDAELGMNKLMQWYQA